MHCPSVQGGAAIATQPGGWDFAIPRIYRCNGMPVTDCDVSPSPYQVRVYVMFSDQRNGTDDTDVFLVTSDDVGATWTAPAHVNDDTGPAHQFFPWVAMDPRTGYVHVVFYGRRNTAGNATDVYLATSTDGGAPFANVEISDSSFTPTASVFFGDYINIAAHGGMVRPIWMRMDGGDLSVRTAIIGSATAVAGERPPAASDVVLEQNVPNPFNPTTRIAFSLPAPARVLLDVFNVRGARVRTLFAGAAPAERSEARWDGTGAGGARVASGVYFYRLRADGRSLVHKMVLIE